MKINMLYGKNGLDLNLPDDWLIDVIRKADMPIIANPDAAIADALKSPKTSRPLSQEAAGKKNACILVCDITRPVPNGLLLPPIIEEIMAGGIAPENITLLIATGLHRPNEGQELEELIDSKWVMDTVKVENHFAKNDDDHVDLGVTKNDTPIKIDKRFVDADLKIVTGLVEPHLMAGYSGGRKVVVPGIAHADTIRRFHSAFFLEHPLCTNCVLDNNPLHEEQLEIVEMLGEVFSLNTVITENRELSFVNFGELVQSHLDAVMFAREFSEVKLPETFDIVITSSAGDPLDKTYYQTIKGMVSAVEILKPGGDLFIVSEISEGLGSPEFVTAQKKLKSMGKEAFLNEIIPKKFADIDLWQTEELIKAMSRGTIRMFTEGLNAEDTDLAGIEVISDLDKFHEAVIAIGQSKKRVAIIPEGPYIQPLTVLSSL